MKQLHGNTSSSRMREWIGLFIFIIILGLTCTVKAQEGSQGNTMVFAGAQATLFGGHNFSTPPEIQGTQIGIIGTERTTSSTGAGYGVVNYALASLNVTGANDANHVDGYVRNLGAGQFLFPVGDNGFYGPFAATGAGTTGAYFHTDATTAITNKLGGGDYPILPLTAGGTAFPTTSKANSIRTVSTVEYWDIDGTNTSKISLTWDSGSDVTTLTAQALVESQPMVGLDYFDVVDPETLEPLAENCKETPFRGEGLAIIAAKVGPVRLIDNVPLSS